VAVGPDVLLYELAVRLVDRAQQLAERRRFLNRPYAIERWTKQVEVATGEQSDSYDAVLGHQTLRKLTYVSPNAHKRLKCQAFRHYIGRAL
jgi:hypothetical protein